MAKLSFVAVVGLLAAICRMPAVEALRTDACTPYSFELDNLYLDPCGSYEVQGKRLRALCLNIITLPGVLQSFRPALACIVRFWLFRERSGNASGHRDLQMDHLREICANLQVSAYKQRLWRYQKIEALTLACCFSL